MTQIRAYFAFRSPYSRMGIHKLAKSGNKPALYRKGGACQAFGRPIE